MAHTKLLLAALLTPLWLTFAILWGTLGLLFTMATPRVVGLALLLLWTPWMLEGLRGVALQVPLAATASVALTLLLPRTTLLHVAAWLVLVQYVASCVWWIDGYAWGYAALACFVSLWSTVNRLRLWLPADEEVLHTVEKQIYQSFLGDGFTLSTGAGLGTVHVPYTGEKKKPRTLVLVHGYGAGNAFWAANLKGLAKAFDVYVVEWKGIGRSERPAFKPKSAAEADAFFVESLEDWRKELKLEQFILCGHSMGALYGTYYAAKYPKALEHVILVSPAGVHASTLTHSELPLGRRIAFALHLTPMSAARGMGPLGPRLVRWMVQKRTSWTPPSNAIRTGELDFELFAKYCYHNWALKASGDIAVHTHLHPGAAARGTPLSAIIVPEKWALPVTFIYGGGPDWMPKEHGEAVVESLHAAKRYASFRVVPLSTSHTQRWSLPIQLREWHDKSSMRSHESPHRDGVDHPGEHDAARRPLRAEQGAADAAAQSRRVTGGEVDRGRQHRRPADEGQGVEKAGGRGAGKYRTAGLQSIASLPRAPTWGGRSTAGPASLELEEKAGADVSFWGSPDLDRAMESELRGLINCVASLPRAPTWGGRSAAGPASLELEEKAGADVSFWGSPDLDRAMESELRGLINCVASLPRAPTWGESSEGRCPHSFWGSPAQDRVAHFALLQVKKSVDLLGSAPMRRRRGGDGSYDTTCSPSSTESDSAFADETNNRDLEGNHRSSHDFEFGTGDEQGDPVRGVDLTDLQEGLQHRLHEERVHEHGRERAERQHTLDDVVVDHEPVRVLPLGHEDGEAHGLDGHDGREHEEEEPQRVRAHALDVQQHQRISLRDFAIVQLEDICGDKVLLVRVGLRKKDYIRPGARWTSSKKLYFELPGHYSYSFAGLTTRKDGTLQFSRSGTWLRLVGDPKEYENARVLKSGFTEISSKSRIWDFMGKIKKAKFPGKEQDVTLECIALNVPDSRRGLHMSEKVARNSGTNAKIRVAWHASNVQYDGFRSPQSEMYELIIDKAGTGEVVMSSYEDAVAWVSQWYGLATLTEDENEAAVQELERRLDHEIERRKIQKLEEKEQRRQQKQAEQLSAIEEISDEESRLVAKRTFERRIVENAAKRKRHHGIVSPKKCRRLPIEDLEAEIAATTDKDILRALRSKLASRQLRARGRPLTESELSERIETRRQQKVEEQIAHIAAITDEEVRQKEMRRLEVRLKGNARRRSLYSRRRLSGGGGGDGGPGATARDEDADQEKRRTTAQ